MKLKEGDSILCTVKRIVGTTVFVRIENEQEKEGTIVTSEIAPGRIRNLRDYVVPGKKIVCKILDIDKQNNTHLSLRRVTEKERKEVLEKEEREKNSLRILKSVIKENAEEIASKIKEKANLYDFLQQCKNNPEKLERYISKEEAEKICKILKEKKERQVEVKKEFKLASNSSDGIIKIKKILLPYKDNIVYLAAGKFMIKVKAGNYKEANKEIEKILSDIENKAREESCEFKIKEK